MGPWTKVTRLFHPPGKRVRVLRTDLGREGQTTVPDVVVGGVCDRRDRLTGEKILISYFCSIRLSWTMT